MRPQDFQNQLQLHIYKCLRGRYPEFYTQHPDRMEGDVEACLERLIEELASRSVTTGPKIDDV